MERAYLDYYRERDIIPVHQQTEDRRGHWRRRTALYRGLGLIPAAFRGARVLEVGPGSGDNAQVTASFDPAEYVLLDGNPASIRAINARLDAGDLDRGVCRVVAGDLHNPPPECPAGGFDIVLAEACLHHQQDPRAALLAVAALVADGGTLVLTTSDEVAVLPDLCRRLLRPAIEAAAGGDAEVACELACQIIDPHLRTLPARSRPTRDWVLDTVFHPWLDHWALSIDDAITTLDDSFDFLGSSPSFMTDWRWYKQFADSGERWNDHARAQWAQFHYASVDWRISNPVPVAEGIDTDTLVTACRRLGRLEHQAWHQCSYDALPEILQTLQVIGDALGRLPGTSGTVAAAADARAGLAAVAAGNLSYPFPQFRHWWGRNMQYLALTRRS